MIKEILSNYNINGELISIDENNSGNINKTLIATFLVNGKYKKYLIQRINTLVFTDPFKLMKNMEMVTSFLKTQYEKSGDSEHRTLEIVKTKDNNVLCEIGNQEYYRIYEYIENAISYDYSTDLDIVFNTGEAFGNFQKMLQNFPMENLEEIIKDFHNTPKRLQSLLNDIKIDPEKRVLEVSREIVYIMQRGNVCSLIMDKLLSGEIPYRVTHNDTKVNNVLMNKETGKFLAVIDLDTVMPGSMLFDYGDGLRSTASNSKEDETDLAQVYINLDLFQAYTDGYMSQMADSLTETEVSLMAESIRIITLELAIRFLNDYINGDTYFKIDYPTHNLDRARNQLKLVADIEEKLEFLNSYIYESYNKYRNEPRI